MTIPNLTPQEAECVRIALDNYEAEHDEAADLLPTGDPAVADHRQEAAVARAAREKFRGVTTYDDYDIVLCEDCTVWHANADSTGIHDADREREVRAARRITELVQSVNPDAIAHVAVGDQVDEFSAQPCGSCGTRLAGSRHAATVMLTVPKENR